MKRKRSASGLSQNQRQDFVLFGIALLVVMIGCGPCIGILALSFIRDGSDDSDFCQPTDSDYQFILAHDDEWISHFASGTQLYPDSLRLQLPEGGTMIVGADYNSTPNESPILYVPELFNLRDPSEGSGGYLIVSTGTPPEYWVQTYYLHPMSDQVFCYRRLG